MTFRCLDSIYPQNLPAGADAYLGYVDGTWPDFQAERQRFPGAHVIGLAVRAQDDAEGCDCENYDLTVAQVPAWTARQLKRGVWRPIVYASIALMRQVEAALAAAGIKRSQVRLLSAHYAGSHICGPSTCRYFEQLNGTVTPQCDGTQWRDNAPGLNGSTVDESLLSDTFFEGSTMSATGPEHWDAADWESFRRQILRGVLAHAGNDYVRNLSTAEAADVHAAHDGLAALIAAELAKLPAAQGGLTQAQVEAAVAAVFAKAAS